ncbi:MAG: heparinase II/III domain-containing protein [Myxococcota bacterium]
MNVGRVLRTVRHIRPRQAWAQVRHLARRGPRRAAAGGSGELRVSAPATPFLPAPRHARWDGGRKIELIGREIVFRDAIDWDFSGEGPLFAYHLHQFDHARSPSLAPDARASLLLDWLERHERGTGWNPHPTSLRILSWGKLLTTPGALCLDAAARARVLGSLADQVETLSRSPEIRLQANHLFSNYLGVAFGALLLRHPRSARWWKASVAPFRGELASQVLEDGLHEERSPMYHALLLENVLDLLNLARAALGAGDAPAGAAALADQLAETAGRMLGALDVLTHPDGEIALFADSAFGIAHPPAVLADYGRRLGIEKAPSPCEGALRSGGYARVEAGPFTALASLAGPAPAHQPGHAHCDMLAFELSLDRERVVSDSGVPEYIPGALREACRSVRGHATLELDGREPAEIWGAHRVGGRPEVAMRVEAPLRAVEGDCRGWSTPDTLHRRRFTAKGDALEVEDTLEGRERFVTARLPLAPGVEARLAGRGDSALRIRTPSGRRVYVRLPRGLHYRIESLPCFPEFGRRVERPCLVGEAQGWRGGVWRFEPGRR